MGDFFTKSFIIRTAQRAADVVAGWTAPLWSRGGFAFLVPGTEIVVVRTQTLDPLPTQLSFAQIPVLMNGRKDKPLKVGQPTRR